MMSWVNDLLYSLRAITYPWQTLHFSSFEMFAALWRFYHCRKPDNKMEQVPYSLHYKPHLITFAF